MDKPENKTNDKVSVVGNFVSLQLESSYCPTFELDRQGKFITWGADNNIPSYLIWLANNNAFHNAILTGKCNYIAGKGLTYDKSIEADDEALIQKWIASANRFYDWNKLIKKITGDFELLNGVAIQIIYGPNGKPLEYYHFDFAKFRVHQDRAHVLYCDNWDEWQRPEFTPKKFPIWTPQVKSGTAIFYFRITSPTTDPYGDVYPSPDYRGAIKDIDTDCEVTNYHNNDIKHGLSANAVVNIYGTEPTEEDKKKIAKKFKSNHTGTNNAGKVILNFTSETSKGADITHLASPESYKQFELLNPRTEKNIFTGHKVTNKAIFGIATEGALGQRKELLEAFEMFTKTYIEVRREVLEEIVQMFAKEAGLNYTAIHIEGTSPIGQEINLSDAMLDEALTIHEKRKVISKQTGVELADDMDTDARLNLAQKLGAGTTQALLTFLESTTITDPQQKRNILRTVFGLSNKKAELLIPIIVPVTTPSTPQPQTQMSGQDPILEALLACAEDEVEGEVLETKFISCSEDAIKFENEIKLKFATVAEGDIKTLRNKILDLLTGAPETTPDMLAKQLGVEKEFIDKQIDWLQEKNFIRDTGKVFDILPKANAKVEDLEPTVVTEIKTVYTYQTRPEVPPAKDGSRPFCQKLMALTSGGKVWTREKIDNITNEFGEDAWIYRGGFYTNPKDKETTPYCRHIWKAKTIKVKKNG